MRRTLPFLTAVLLLAGLGVAAGAAAAGSSPRARLRDFGCQRALDPPNRTMSITAVMRPLPGTRRLALKFDLLVRRGGEGPARQLVRAGDLGVWISPADPTLGRLAADVWRVQKQVVELAAPAAYRFRVSFRWIGAAGQVLGTAVRYTQRCAERELRPDLLIDGPLSVTAIAGHPDKALYTAVIRNAGATAAGPFDVLFAPSDGSPPRTRTVRVLRAHHSRTESFAGPLCTAGSAPTITVDSAAQVDDLDRANNALTAVCSATATG